MSDRSSGNKNGKNILLYACSGAANVAEIADRVARQLTRDGCGAMFCLAGLGAGIPAMVGTARDADLNVLIDGCELDCARKILDNCKLDNYVQLRVTDLGVEKAKGAPATDEQIAEVARKVRRELGES